MRTPEGETAVAGPPFLSLGEAATELGCKDWHVRQVFARGLVPEPERVGGKRLIPRSLLGDIRRALLAAGYLLSGGLSR
jgi:hypothetical protein